jgi:hypothetical protein
MLRLPNGCYINLKYLQSIRQEGAALHFQMRDNHQLKVVYDSENIAKQQADFISTLIE